MVFGHLGVSLDGSPRYVPCVYPDNMYVPYILIWISYVEIRESRLMGRLVSRLDQASIRGENMHPLVDIAASSSGSLAQSVSTQ